MNKTLLSVSVVILCGGNGTRLWPISREDNPKQFNTLEGTESLLEKTIKRMLDCQHKKFTIDQIVICGNINHKFLILEQIKKFSGLNVSVILEPLSKNTCASLTLSALFCEEKKKDCVLLVVPADHIIEDDNSFKESIKNAIGLAHDNAFVILGVHPDYPETGYGYIESEGAIDDFGSYSVNKFIEKPNISEATNFISNENYFWNSGIFVLKSSIWLSALERFRPLILDSVKKSWTHKSVDGFYYYPKSTYFNEFVGISIDHGVLENCNSTNFQIRMIPLSSKWSDLGSWNSFWSNSEKDPDGNVILGDVYQIKTSNSLIYSSSRLICSLGLEDLIVIETADAILISKKNMSQEVKKIFSKMENNGRREISTSPKVFRPWGWFYSLDYGANFKVKRICLNPKSSISLQYHKKRAEHWVVVKGKAHVSCNGNNIILYENESTYIPIGAAHRLSNKENDYLEVIEIQTGYYLEEDDIYRVKDDYGR